MMFNRIGQKKILKTATILKGKNRSGAMLIIVLWILAFLIILAVGLGRRGSVVAALSQMTTGEMRARYLAVSAARYASELMGIDTRDERGSKQDTLYECGFLLPEGVTRENLFQGVSFPGGYFDIISSFSGDPRVRRLGFSDEDGKLNLNAVTAANAGVLKHLIMQEGFPVETAETIASSVVDWTDEDDMVFHESYGQENEPSSTLGARVKNNPFKSVYELLLIRGMTREIYDAVRADLTVFPTASGLVVNLDTASPKVLRALARHFTASATNTELSDADSLIDKLVRLRRGADGQEGTKDDREIESAEVGLNSRERAIMAQMEGYRARVSNFIRLGIRAVDEPSGFEYRVEAVFSRPEGKIVEWRRIR